MTQDNSWQRVRCTSPDERRRAVARQIGPIAASILIVLAQGCGEAATSEDVSNVGSVSMSLVADDVARVVVAISGPHIEGPHTVELEKDGDQWVGVLGGIPAGVDRTFSASAFDAANVLAYQGELTGVTIIAGETVSVMLVLQQTAVGDPFHNTPPRVIGSEASTDRVAPGETVRLRVSATDADGDPLSFTWSATAGDIPEADTPTNTWTAPSTTGVQTVTVAVSDGRGGTRSIQWSFDVQPYHAEGSAAVDVTLNRWPEVERVSASPSWIEPGSNVAMSVSAIDADGDTLSFVWSDAGGECAGSFDDADAENPTWTAPASAPASFECVLTVVADDGRGGRQVGSAIVFVGAPEGANVAPRIGSTFQSQLHVAPGKTVRFELMAVDPEGSALTFAWAASEGELVPQAGDGARRRAIWTAPPTCDDVSIAVTVTDAAGASSVHTFNVAVDMPAYEESSPDGISCRAGQPATSRRIGTEGGVIHALDDTVILEIPPGAIPERDEDGDGVNDTVVITITPDAYVVDGNFIPSIALEPHGTTFETPVMLTMSYSRFVPSDADEALVTLTKFEEDGERNVLATEVNRVADIVRAPLSSFSNVALGTFCTYAAPKAVAVAPNRPIVTEGYSASLSATVVGIPAAPPLWASAKTWVGTVDESGYDTVFHAQSPGVTRVTASVSSCIYHTVARPDPDLIPPGVVFVGSVLGYIFDLPVGDLLKAINKIDHLTGGEPPHRTYSLIYPVIGESFVSVQDATCANVSCRDDGNTCTMDCVGGACAYTPTDEGGECPKAGFPWDVCAHPVCRSGNCDQNYDLGCIWFLCVAFQICAPI